MRINKFVALATGLSRRAADTVIAEGRVTVNGQPAQTGQEVSATDTVKLDSEPLQAAVELVTIMLNKPPGYVVSRDGQGSPTVYDLLPPQYSHLKPVGRLDKDSSGLLLLTNDGQLAQTLTHPSHQKEKVYEVELDRSLTEPDRQTITVKGVDLDDGSSKLILQPLGERSWQVTMREGRNRQIRRTFETLDYKVVKLHRTQFGEYVLNALPAGQHQPANPSD